jgi:transposase
MYFRTKTVGKTALVQLVESYRNGEGQPRQRVIASLGDAELPEADKRAIADAVERRLSGQSDWMEENELSCEASTWVARIVQLARRSKGGNQSLKEESVDGVLVDRVQTQDVVQLGPQLVAAKAWQALGLSVLLEELGMNPGSVATAELLVANRLVEPLSEWALIDWSQRTALPEMLGLRLTKTGKDRLYRVGDELLEQRKMIEARLRQQQPELFGLERSVILYDVTNTHFEGLCRGNPKARHGKNKQQRNDCRQVAVGMAFDEHGMPLAHEVFEGNIADTKTLEAMLDRLESGNVDLLKPVVVLDAGFASKGNLELLKKKGYSYLVNMTRSRRSQYAEQFRSEGFEPLGARSEADKVEVKRITDPDDSSSELLLCRSTRRKLKEEAMISRAEERFLADLDTLAKRVQDGRLKRPSVIERKIGSLQKKHPRVQRFYKIELRDRAIHWQRDEANMSEVLSQCGDYVLKTDKTLGAEELWRLYMTLLKAEAGFGMLKGSLGLRPNYHQLEERVEAHIFISVLAYHLLMWVQHRLEQHGDTRNWKTLRRLLSTHSLASTTMPLKDGTIVQIRKPSIPDAEQLKVFQRLGIDWKAPELSSKTVKKQ